MSAGKRICAWLAAMIVLSTICFKFIDSDLIYLNAASVPSMEASKTVQIKHHSRYIYITQPQYDRLSWDHWTNAIILVAACVLIWTGPPKLGSNKSG